MFHFNQGISAMRFYRLILAILTCGILFPPDLGLAQTDQLGQVAPTQSSEDPSPVAAVDPARPIQIRVLNRSDSTVEVVSQLIQPTSNERKVGPGRSVIFGRLHTSYLPLPLEMMMYVKADNIGLDLEVRVENNEIILVTTAKPTADSSMPGSQSISVDAAGDIYLNLN